MRQPLFYSAGYIRLLHVLLTAAYLLLGAMLFTGCATRQPQPEESLAELVKALNAIRGEEEE